MPLFDPISKCLMCPKVSKEVSLSPIYSIHKQPGKTIALFIVPFVKIGVSSFFFFFQWCEVGRHNYKTLSLKETEELNNNNNNKTLLRSFFFFCFLVVILQSYLRED